jgi:type 1 glutamine amidotransferase
MSNRIFNCSFVAIAALVALGLPASSHVSAADKAEPATLRILFYGSAVPAVVDDLKKIYRIEVMVAGAKANKDKAEATGLEQLDKTDLFIGTTQKRTMPSKAQLAHVRKYFEAGKPFVGFRQASHMFQNWLESDKYIVGAKYGGHHLQNKEPMLKLEIAKGQENHPTIKGLKLPHPSSGSYFYSELDKDVTLLISCGLPGDMQPHTWVRENAKTKNRVFYTRYDAEELTKEPVVREIFLRGIAWALNEDAKRLRVQ